MNLFRIALANTRFPATPAESVALAEQAIAQAGIEGAGIICFPECFVPGYRGVGKRVPPPDPAFLERAWSAISQAAAKASLAVVLGTERIVDGTLLATALVVNSDGTIAGFQDKVQIDPSEEGLYAPGSGRRVFQTGPLTFGIAICHEGWRYPETVRWAVRHGAHIVFHPHFHEAEPGSYQPASFADPANSFHEKAALCRAAENTCYFATVNFASAGSPTTSAVLRPDGTLLACQPYGQEGLLMADIDLAAATGLLASRIRPGFGEPRAAMPPVKDLHRLLASMNPTLEDGEFVFVSRPAEPALGPLPEAVIGSFREKEGVTWIMRREESERRGFPAAFPCRMITLNVVSDLEAVGFLARVAAELAAQKISVNAISAYHHDYLFVPAGRAKEALQLLRRLQDACLA